MQHVQTWMLDYAGTKKQIKVQAGEYTPCSQWCVAPTGCWEGRSKVCQAGRSLNAKRYFRTPGSNPTLHSSGDYMTYKYNICVCVCIQKESTYSTGTCWNACMAQTLTCAKKRKQTYKSVLSVASSIAHARIVKSPRIHRRLIKQHWRKPKDIIYNQIV